MRILVVTAVAAELEAVLAAFGASPPAVRSYGPAGVLRTCGGVTVVPAGVGQAAAAAGTATVLADAAAAGRPYDLVVSAGIGGGFPGRAPVGTAVVASQIVAADLGAESAGPAGGFVTLGELGFGSHVHPVPEEPVSRWAAALREAGVPTVVGPVLTVSTVTGSAERAAALALRHPGAAAEGMEGFGVATAAALHGLPVMELRAVSNAVGPRDRASWRIGEALATLTRSTAVLFGGDDPRPGPPAHDTSALPSPRA